MKTKRYNWRQSCMMPEDFGAYITFDDHKETVDELLSLINRVIKKSAFDGNVDNGLPSRNEILAQLKRITE